MQWAEDGVRNQKQFERHDGGDDKSQHHHADVDVINRVGLGIGPEANWSCRTNIRYDTIFCLRLHSHDRPRIYMQARELLIRNEPRANCFARGSLLSSNASED